MPAPPDYLTVQRSMRWALSRPGSVVEVRTIEQYRGRCQVGYFNDVDMVSNAVCHSDNEGLAGIYATINPVHPDLFARCSNRMMAASAGQFTKDVEILERRGLLLDFDPERFSGISSTDEEHAATLEHMKAVTWDLTQFHGFPVPCLIDSGNGGHGKYLLEALPNEPDSTNLIRTFLHCMDARYSTPHIKIDKTVFNASRIVRIPGTLARKGENTLERPHRLSRILQDYDPLDTLSRASIERFIGLYGHLVPSGPVKASGGPVDVLRHLREYPHDEQPYRALNNAAKLRYHEYASNLLGDLVTPTGDEYHITQDKLGRELTERIRIGPWGIKDYGVADMGDETEGRRQAVTLISELLTGGNKRQAAELLAICLNMPVTPFSDKLIMPPLKSDLGPSALHAPSEPVTMPDALMGLASFAMPQRYRDVDLLNLQDTKWLVPGFVIEDGFTMLSAPTKMGKSTLTKQMLAACMVGGKFLDIQCPKVEVLYIAYEDMENDILRDMQRVLRLTLRDMGVPEQDIPLAVAEALDRRFHWYARKQGEAGEFFERVPTGRRGLDFIVKLTTEVFPNVKITCVDPIRLLNDETVRSRNINTQQYHEGLDMLNLAVKGRTAVWGLHHNNKESGKKVSEGNDPLLSVSGTASIAGSAQNVIVFNGDRIPDGVDGATEIYISSRIGPVRSKIVKFHEGRFYLAPPDTEVYYRRNHVKTADPNIDVKIVAELDRVGGMTAPALAEALNIQKYTIDRRLAVLKEQELVDWMEDNNKLLYKGRGGPARIWFLTKAVTLPKTI